MQLVRQVGLSSSRSEVAVMVRFGRICRRPQCRHPGLLRDRIGRAQREPLNVLVVDDAHAEAFDRTLSAGVIVSTP